MSAPKRRTTGLCAGACVIARIRDVERGITHSQKARPRVQQEGVSSHARIACIRHVKLMFRSTCKAHVSINNCHVNLMSSMMNVTPSIGSSHRGPAAPARNASVTSILIYTNYSLQDWPAAPARGMHQCQVLCSLTTAIRSALVSSSCQQLTYGHCRPLSATDVQALQTLVSN
jgi:hypothetical protein